jgi:hypothetical protein
MSARARRGQTMDANDLAPLVSEFQQSDRNIFGSTKARGKVEDFIRINRFSLNTWWWVNAAAVVAHLATIGFMIGMIVRDGSGTVPVSVTALTGRPGAANTTVVLDGVGPAHPRWIAFAFEIICVFMHILVYPVVECYSSTEKAGGLRVLDMTQLQSSEYVNGACMTDENGRYAYYDGVVARRHNPYRWAEYSVSASLIFTGVQVICGVVDFSALASAFAANFAVMWFGWWSEKSNMRVFERPDTRNVGPFVLGAVAALGPWIGVIISVVKIRNGVPSVALAAMGTLAGFFFSFAQIELFYVIQCFRMSYVDKEVFYTILSCICKVTLSFLIFYSTEPV